MFSFSGLDLGSDAKSMFFKDFMVFQDFHDLEKIFLFKALNRPKHFNFPFLRASGPGRDASRCLGNSSGRGKGILKCFGPAIGIWVLVQKCRFSIDFVIFHGFHDFSRIS